MQAITTPNTKEAVRAWAQSLSPDDLLDVGDAIQSYPVLYRKEIMRASSPERRAEIWRNHIQTYLDTNPHVSSDAIPVLQAAIQLITPALFSPGGDKLRAETALIADQVTAILGRAEAEYLFYRLGPRDEQIASIEPIGLRLANYVRDMMVALARTDDCDCSTGWGCDYGGKCRTTVTCNVDSEWPACGWMWNEECDGLCGAGSETLP
ncbi:MAG TPA: bacteriocin fulvocin C-related protein [Vicinamibacterales bacterium]|nr:bacteriocin fulvocin C-related protein [Vicinamibacterales bacterium]